MKEAVERIVKALADKPEEVVVSEKTGDRSVSITVRVAESDMGKLIGREGRTIKSIRSILYAASQKHGKRYILEVVE
jgi:predicted RNA-binding protein YlqC (UPF0109 family)